MRIDADADGDTLEIDTGCSGFLFFSGCSVSYDITVPAGTQVSVETISGTVSVAPTVNGADSQCAETTRIDSGRGSPALQAASSPVHVSSSASGGAPWERYRAGIRVVVMTAMLR